MIKVKQPNGKKTFIKRGDTKDIVKAVIQVLSQSDVEDIKGWVKGNFTPDKKGLSKLWHWVKKNVKYQEDPDGQQLIKTPSRTFHERDLGTDCKSFSVFIAKCLEALGVPYTVRFISQGNSKNPTHVYVVAYLNGEPTIMDAVYTKFNQEPNYTYKQDFDMTNIYAVSGVYQKEDQISGFQAWFRNKTINKVAVMALHAFVPYAVKPNTRTAVKIAKAKKILKWFVKNSPVGEKPTINIIRAAIKEKIGMSPEDYFLQVKNQKDKIGEPITMAAIITLVTILAPVVIAIVNKGSGADQSKDDRIPNEGEIQSDLIPDPTPNNTAATNTGTTPSNTSQSSTPSGGSNNTLLIGGGILAALFFMKK